jgi:hypothetical protein
MLMTEWYGRLAIRLRACAHAPLRLHDLRHATASLATEACAHLEADPSTPRSPRRSTGTATSWPGMDEALAEEMDEVGRAALVGGNRGDALTHVRWGRVSSSTRLRSAGLA